MFLCPSSSKISVTNDNQSKELCNSNLNSNNNNNCNESRDDSSIDEKSLIYGLNSDDHSEKSNESDTINNVKKRIIYTKEFLLHLRLREASNSYPEKLLPKFENEGEVYWDPEKYFDSVKGLKQTKTKSDFIGEKKLHFQKPMNSDRTNYMLNFGIIRNNYMLHPGELVDVSLCSIITKNNFYVNLSAMKGAFQQLSSILNVFCNNQLVNLLNVNINHIKKDEIFLAFYGNIWQRVKLIENLSPENNKLKVFCVDNGKEFETCFSMPCPKEFSDIPGFGINVSLGGIDKDFDLRVLNEFTRNQDNLKMKILFFNKSKSKYYVELFNDQKISLNYLLNSKFQKQLFILNDEY